MSAANPSAVEAELLNVSRQLLSAIDTGNWNAYAQLVDPSITCFEPEALGHLVEGMPFHKYYFDLPPAKNKQSTIASPHVRVMGDVAVVTYIRVVQKLDAAGGPVSAAAEETRVWQKQAGGWKHVHFHRSPLG